MTDQLPTNRNSFSSRGEHLRDHNVLHAGYNAFRKLQREFDGVKAEVTALQSAIDTLGSSESDISVNVKAYGAIGDGVTDDTEAIQAALDSIDLSAAKRGTVLVPTGTYMVTAPLVIYPGTNFKGVGHSSSGDGSYIFAKTGSGGFSGTAVVMSSTWTDDSDWNCSSIEDLRINAGDQAQYAVAIHNFGSESVIRRVRAENSTSAAMFFAGKSHATIENCFTYDAPYGLRCSSHPTYTTNNYGTVRIFGIDGSNNTTAHMRFDGQHRVNIEGMRSSGHARGIEVGGSSTGADACRVTIVGGWQSLAANGVGIYITNTARPVIAALGHSVSAISGTIKFLEDTVRSKTLSSSGLNYQYNLVSYGGTDVMEEGELSIRHAIKGEGSFANNAIFQGRVQFNDTSLSGGPLVDVSAATPSTVGLKLTGASGQTADTFQIRSGSSQTGKLLNIQDSAGTTQVYVDTSFNLVANLFRGGNGTASAPSLSFSGDTNTGIYREAADTLAITTNSTKRLSIGSTGITSAYGPLDLSAAGASGYLVLPKLTSTQRAALSTPVDGTLIFNTTTNQIEVYENSSWLPFLDATDANTAGKAVARNASGDFSTRKINLNALFLTRDSSVQSTAIDVVSSTGSTDLLLRSRTSSGATYPTFSLGASGALQWGSGAVATDTLLQRSAANTLSMGASGTMKATTFEGTTFTGTTFSGNAATATKLATARKINDVAFDGSQDITIATGVLTKTIAPTATDSYIVGTAFDGSANVQWKVDATANNTASKVVARDANNAFSVTSITGNKFTLTRLSTSTADSPIRVTVPSSGGMTTSSLIFGSLFGSDTVERFAIASGGTLSWGAGSASSRDTYLERSGTNTLRLSTNGTSADGNLSLGTVSAVNVNASGMVSAPFFTGNLTGNVTGKAATASTADQADKWTTARSLSLSGDISATITSVDGSANRTATATIGDSKVTPAKLSYAVAGRGLDGGAGHDLYVVPDGDILVNETVLVVDNFDRANSATALSNLWTSQRGTWGINANEGYLAVNSGTYNIATRSHNYQNHSLTMQFGSSVQDGMGVVWRWVDNNNFYALYRSGSGSSLVLLKRVDGANTTTTISGVTTGANTEMRVTFVGDRHNVYVDNIHVYEYQNNEITDGYNVGLYATSAVTTSARWGTFTLKTDVISANVDTATTPGALPIRDGFGGFSVGYLTLEADPAADEAAVRRSYMNGPYVLAHNSQMTAGTHFSLNAADYTKVRNFSSGTITPSNCFSLSTGVFTAPRAGVYQVSFTAGLDPDDPADFLIAKALYRFRVAVRNTGGTVVRSVKALQISPYPLNHDVSPYGDIAYLGNELLMLNSSTPLYCEAGNSIAVEVMVGGFLGEATGSEYPMLEHLMITWVHGGGAA